MNTVKADYRRRVLEIDDYIKYVETLEKTTGISTTLMATMKASAILMLYNLVESTMTNISQAVFDHLKQKNIGFDQINDIVKILVLRNVKKRNPTNLVKKMRDDSLDFVVASFDREDIFSGNIDAKKIRETLKEFGAKQTRKISEPVLLEIKTLRNELAHGAKSFADSGKNFTAQDLAIKQGKVDKALSQALLDFDSYIQTAAYS